MVYSVKIKQETGGQNKNGVLMQIKFSASTPEKALKLSEVAVRVLTRFQKAEGVDKTYYLDEVQSNGLDLDPDTFLPFTPEEEDDEETEDEEDED